MQSRELAVAELEAAGVRQLRPEGAELVARLREFNPVNNLPGMLANKEPMFVVHRDSDVVVSYDLNTRLLQERYEAGGGQIAVKVIPGKGHKLDRPSFECRELVNFVL